ncbi:MAG: D-alanyl-D-alanine carboxypeptidase/D-alanyl-D-alanine endopeptidase [Elainellaceae cyanobacterium]
MYSNLRDRPKRYMRFMSAVILSLLPMAPAAVADEGVCPADLGSRIEAIATRSAFDRARWGILVQTLPPSPLDASTVVSPGQIETLYARDARQFFIPASNVKLFTTAAALTRLHPQFRIRTSVYRESSASGETVLRVVGRGDPTLTDADLDSLAQQIGDRSITHITHLIGDDRYFQGSAINPNWEWEDVQAGYGAPASSLILNENEIRVTLTPQDLGEPLRVDWDDPAEATRWQINNRSTTVAATEPEFVEVGRDFSQPILNIRGQLRIGARPDESAVSIPDPTDYFLQRLRQVLIAANISVHQIAIAHSERSDGQEIAALHSPPLAELLGKANRDSNNLYAESLLRQMGAVAPAASSSSALDDGIARAQATLTQLGIDPSGYVMADGSGLSRHNLASPEAFVQTLQAMARSPHAQMYRNSLAVAGVNGTLANRFRDTAVAGNLYGKTGGLTGVSSLSGYLDPPNYVPLAFSILIDHSDKPGSVRRAAIDEIVLQMAQLQVCP